MKEHHYKINLKWTGNKGKGTENYRSYERDFVLSAKGKQTQIPGSSDPAFLGDPSRYNPEDMLVASLSSCHMLWYLHLCSVHNIIVTAYVDHAEGVMSEAKNGGGKFEKVILRPNVIVKEDKMIDKALELHHEANKMCFIANSCNFPVLHEALVQPAYE